MATATLNIEVLKAAYALLHERVKPAQLEQSNENGVKLGKFIYARGGDPTTMSAEELASLMYDAVNQNAEQFVWAVKPKKLAKYDDKGLINDAKTLKEAQAFVEQVKNAEAAAAQKKLDDKDRAATKKLIESMVLSKLSTTADYKLRLHKRVERAVKQGVKWDAIHRDITRKVAELNHADERSQERVGQFRDLLAEVEV